MNIDWSKAPQWADRVLAMGMTGAWAWANGHQYQYIGKINKEIFLYEEENTWKLSDGELVEMRHSVEVWQGTGLPPVGCKCEVQAAHINDGYWTEVEILAHAKHDEDDALLVCQLENGRRADMDGVIYAPERFRPIRTQAQIEAEEREKAIYAMLEIYQHRYVDTKTSIAALYDAGYRKQPKEDA